MLTIAGRLHVDPDARDAYLEECVPIVEQARRAPGCQDFALTADLVDPTRIDVYERWDSDEALLAFRGSGPSSDQQVAIRVAEVRKYRISAVEDP